MIAMKYTAYEIKIGTKILLMFLVAILLNVLPSAQAASSARADVNFVNLKLFDLDSDDGISPNIEGYELSTRGMSLYATNWENYTEPTQATRTVNPAFSQGSLSINNANADASISVYGDILEKSGASITTTAHAYGAPVHGAALGTRVFATQDNLNLANGHLRVTPNTRIEISGQFFFEGSITDTPYPFSQSASSLVLITFGRDGVVPISFLRGVSVYNPVLEGALASSYSEEIPFSLTFNNYSSGYIDDFLLQFTVQSAAITNVTSTVPEPSSELLAIIGIAGLFFLGEGRNNFGRRSSGCHK